MSEENNEKSALVPRLRFPEFREAGEWERKELNEFLFEYQQRNRGLKYGPQDVLSVSGEFGCVNQIEHLGRSYAGVSVKDYRVVETGDIVYTKSPLKKNPFGIVKENKGKPGIVSTLYAVYRGKENAHPAYFDHYFSRDYFLNAYLQPLVKKGAKNDMKVNNSVVLSGDVIAPKKDEQQKIAACLSSLNELITAETQKLDILKTHKKGLVQQLFPCAGVTIPRLRFPEFLDAGEWEYQDLGKLSTRVNRKNSDAKITRVLTNSAEHGVIDQRDFFDKDIANQANLDGYYIVEKGDYVYNPRISVIAPVGPISRNNLGTGVMSPLYTVFRFDSEEGDFYAHYFKSSHWHHYMRQTSSTGARHDRISITNDNFMGLPLPVPTEAEQHRIAECLSSLDELITAQAKRLGLLRCHKSGLMQQLFPVLDEVPA